MYIQVDRVSHRYEEDWILRDVDLRVEAGGESLAVLGPSGSGKSTLLAIAGGLLRPTLGEIFTGGLSLRHPRNVAWIHQGSQGLQRRTALENVAIGALAVGHAPNASVIIAERELERLGLSSRRDAPFRQLSGGERQRVTVARALATNARFLLADEPTGSVDKANTLAILDVIFERVCSRKLSLLVATHDDDVATMCSRVLRVRDSHVLEQTA